jgi:micrococcal nuclease
MVFRKTVDVKPIDTDRYGRTVGIVICDRMNLNVELIRAGYAWVYDQYCTRPDCKVWEFIEAKARDEQNGLWSVPNPTPPWEFRRNGNSVNRSTGVTTPKGTLQAAIVYHGYHAPGCQHYDCKNCTAVFSVEGRG